MTGPFCVSNAISVLPKLRVPQIGGNDIAVDTADLAVCVESEVVFFVRTATLWRMPLLSLVELGATRWPFSQISLAFWRKRQAVENRTLVMSADVSAPVRFVSIAPVPI
jgi:hypothetical protein